ncbi:hypothetical protein TCON_2287 [Astathelohania contejeani]|uniref:Uncharacterized protein n=1 Tax=Astathelohania contejeani TaxID=164912 RepID=A0ABQ7HWH4_9MICR|nr:hypothetical protein TCON_2287 [Thelohania contejeani]
MNGKGLYPTLKLIFIELITLYRQNCTDVQDLYTLKKLFSPQFEYVEEKLLGRNFPLKKWWCKQHRRPWSVAYNRPHIFCNKNNRCDLCIGPPILPGKLNTSLSSPIFNIKEYNIQLKKYKRKWKNLIYYENIIKTQTKTKITRPLSTNSKRKVSMFGSILFLNIFYFISKSLI